MNLARAEIFITAAQEAALTLLSKGLCIKKMATELGISESAVKARLSSVRQKLAVHTNIQAVVEALRLGYLNGDTGRLSDMRRPIMTDRRFVDVEGATEIGVKIVEMADRCRSMDRAVPGASVNWHFDVRGVRYSVSLAVTS